MAFGISFGGGLPIIASNTVPAHDSILEMARLLSRLTMEFAAMSHAPGFEAAMGSFSTGDFMPNESASLDRLLNELFEQAVASPSLSGLSAEQFARLPRRKAAETDDSSCAICQEAYKVGQDTIVALPCKHVYHEDCIGPWIKRTSSCPMCRRPVDEQNK